MAQVIRRPVFRLWMENLGGDPRATNIAPLVTSCTYTDRAHGESDEISIEIDDFDGDLFKTDWMPNKGQGIGLALGYEPGLILDCGRFEIDEVEFRGPPDMLTIRALNADIKKALRTDQHQAYENVTLLDVAQRIAQRHGYSVIGSGTGGMANIPLERVSQDDEADLAFLKRLAEPYGYVFKVTARSLVFHSIRDLEYQYAYVTLDRKQLNSYSLNNSSRAMYRTCEVRYHDPRTGRMVSAQANDRNVVKGDTLKLTVRCENEAQARVMAQESLRSANAGEISGNLQIQGNPALAAGYVFNLTGLQRLSGRYLIETSSHTISRHSGYTTDLQVRKVRYADLT